MSTPDNSTVINTQSSSSEISPSAGIEASTQTDDKIQSVNTNTRKEHSTKEEGFWENSKQLGIEAATTVLGATQVVVNVLKDKVQSYSNVNNNNNNTIEKQQPVVTQLSETIDTEVIPPPANSSHASTNTTPTTEKLSHSFENIKLKAENEADKVHKKVSKELDVLDDKADKLLDKSASKAETLANKANIAYENVKSEAKFVIQGIKEDVAELANGAYCGLKDFEDAVLGKPPNDLKTKAKVKLNEAKEEFSEAKQTALDVKEISSIKIEEGKEELKKRQVERKAKKEEQKQSSDVITDKQKQEGKESSHIDFKHDATVLDVE